jgi:hypothetical protein
MSTFLEPHKRESFTSPVLEQFRSQNEIQRNSSNVSLVMTEHSASGSLATNARQSRRLTKANFDEALRIRTVGPSYSDNWHSIDLWIDDQVPLWQGQFDWLV